MGCNHTSHTPKGICLGCGEQHVPLPGYTAEELGQREAEFFAEDTAPTNPHTPDAHDTKHWGGAMCSNCGLIEDEMARHPICSKPHTPDAEIGGLVHFDLVPLLRREGHHSGVWFADKLLDAADTIETLLRTQADNAKRIADLEAAMRSAEQQTRLCGLHETADDLRKALKGSSNHEQI